MGSFERRAILRTKKGNGIAVTVPPKAAGLPWRSRRKARPNATPSPMNCRSCRRSTIRTLPSCPLCPTSSAPVRQECPVSLCPVFDPMGWMLQPGHAAPDEHDILPQATFCRKQRDGLHLYYVLEEPYPHVPAQPEVLEELKYSLTRQI